MGVPTFAIQIDPSRAGSWVDITDYAGGQNPSFTIARQNPFEGGFYTSNLSLALRNKNDYFSPRNTSSGIFGYIKPRLPIRVRCTHNAVTRTLWSGYIMSWEYTYEPGTDSGKVSVNCTDILGTIINYTFDSATIEDQPFASSTFSDSRPINSVLSAAGLVSGDVSLQTASTTCPIFFGTKLSVGTILKELLVCEPGYLYVTGAGIVTFKSYSFYAAGVSGSARDWGQYSTNSVIMPVAAKESIEHKFIDTVEVSTNRYAKSSTDADAELHVVFRQNFGDSENASLLPAGASWKWTIRPNIVGITGIVEGSIVCKPGIDIIADSTSGGTGSESAIAQLSTTTSTNNYLTITNTGATSIYIVKWEVRGIPITDKGVARADRLLTTSATNDTGIGSTGWTNVTNVYTTNATYGSVTLAAASGTSNFLKCTAFGFNLPSNASIYGMRVVLKSKITLSHATDQANFDAGTSVGTLYARVVKGGTIQPGPSAYYGFPYKKLQYINGVDGFVWPIAYTAATSVQELSIGGGSYTWGAAAGGLLVSPSDINDSGFGVALYLDKGATNGTITIDIDSVALAILYYADKGASGNSTDSTNAIKNVATLPYPDPDIKGSENLNYSLKWIADEGFGRDYAMAKLRIWRKPFSRITLLFKWANDTIIGEMLDYADFNYQIHYKDTGVSGSSGGGTYSDGYFYIESVTHNIKIGSLSTTEVTLIPAYQYRNYSKIMWDDFSGDGTSSTPGSGDIGKTVTGHDWNGDADVYKAPGSLVLSATTTAQLPYLNFSTGGNNHIVECSFNVTSLSTHTARTGVIFKGGSGVSTGYIAYVERASSGAYKFYIDNIFSGLHLHTTSDLSTLIPDIAWPLELTIISFGSEHSAYINGIYITTLSSAAVSSTRVGLYLYKSDTSVAVSATNFYSQVI